MARGRSLAVLALAGVMSVGTAACGDGGGGTVNVTLQEFAVILAESSVQAGAVTFEATNEGPADPHELVVIKTDLAPDALPTNDVGLVDEEGEGIEVIGEDCRVPDRREQDRQVRLGGRKLRAHLQRLRGGAAGVSL